MKRSELPRLGLALLLLTLPTPVLAAPPTEPRPGGILDHTISAREIYELRLNGRPVGEVGLNAAVAGHLHVPVVLVSGDHKLAGEVEEIIPWAERVIVKEAIGRHASRAMHPERACQAIEQGLARAVGRLSEMRPYEIETPVTAAIAFKFSSMADAATHVAGATRVNDLTVRITAPDAIAVYPLIMSAVHLGGFAVAAPMKLGSLNPPGA